MSEERKLDLTDTIAEKSVLSALLSDKDSASEIVELLRPEMFSKMSHRVIFEAAMELTGMGMAVDMTTVQGRLADSDKLDSAGGSSNLIQICNFAPNADSWDDYASVVEDKWKLRRLEQVAGSIHGIVHDPDILTADEKIETAHGELTQIETRKSENEQESIKGVVKDVFQVVDDALDGKDVRPGIPTGIKSLDAIIPGGLRRGSNIVVGARPAMGKTSLARAIAVNICQTFKVQPTEDSSGERYTGCFISLEVPRIEFVRSAMSMIGKYPVAWLEGIPLNNSDDYTKVSNSAEVLQSLRLDIRDTTETFTVSMISNAITRTIRKYGCCDFVMVDYIQLMSDDGHNSKSDNRAYEIKRIAQKCKNYAKKFDLPIMLLAQVSRSVDDRDNKRPQISDLSDSSGIENAADLIMMIYRDAYYVAKETGEKEPDVSSVEIIVRKNRQGRTGTAKLAFQPSFARFVEAAA